MSDSNKNKEQLLQEIQQLKGQLFDLKAASGNPSEQNHNLAEEHLHDIVEHTRQVIYKLDVVEGRFDYISPSLQNLVGFTKQELNDMGMEKFFSRLHPDDFKRTILHFTNLPSYKPEDKIENTIEYRWMRKDGQYRWVSDSRTLVNDESGKPRWLVGMIHDVTDRYQTEEKLRVSESHLNDIVEYASDVIYKLDVSASRYDYISPSIEKLIGFTVVELNDMPMEKRWAIVHPDDFERYTSHFENLSAGILDNQIENTIEYRCKCKDGHYKWLSDSRTLVNDESGKPKWIIGVVRDITARLKAEEEISISEKHLRDIVEHASEVIYKLDVAAGRYDYLSPSFERLTGFTPDELDEMGMEEKWQRYHPDDIERYKSHFTNLSAGILDEQIESTIEYRWKCKDGQYKWASNSRTVVNDQSGKPKWIVGIVRDINDSHNAQEKLNLLSSAIQQSREGVAVVDENQKLLFVNNAFAQLHGYTPEEVIGKHISVFHTDQQMEEVKELFGKLNETGQFDGNIWHRHRDGTNFLGQMQTIQLFDSNGNVAGGIGTLRDITQAQRSEESLHYRTNFENLITNISTCFVNTPAENTDAVILRSLKALGEFMKVDGCAIVELSQENQSWYCNYEWCNKGIDSRKDRVKEIPTSHSSWWMQQLKESGILQIADIDEMPQEASQAKAIIEGLELKSLIVVPMLFDQHVAGFMVLGLENEKRQWRREGDTFFPIIVEMFANIMSRRRTCLELDEYRSRMFRAEQLASLGTVSATLAHELNQPLTVLRLFLQQAARALNNEQADISRVRDNVAECLESVDNAENIVNRFRRFARKSSCHKIVETDIVAIAERTVHVLEENARRSRLIINLNINNGPLVVKGNSADFEQIFFVLIQNSIQASRGKDWHKLDITADKLNGKIDIKFKDTCGGIERANVEKIFEPFFTTKLEESGTGLGLCILNRIIDKYNGSIEVDNDPGIGVRFHLSVPCQ